MAKKGFAVTVEGLYMVDSAVGRKSEKKAYKVEVNVPKYGDDTLSVIKNRLLESAIRRFDPSYKTYLTHSITGVRPLGEGAPAELTGKFLTIKNMSVTQLTNYVRGNKLPVALHLYTNDILEFRRAIESCEADVKKFLIKQKAMQEDYEVQKELADLNPDLETAGEVKINPTPTVENTQVRTATETTYITQSSVPESKPEPEPEPEPVKELTNEEIVAAATKEAEKPKVASEDLDNEISDEGYLSDGSEAFGRPSEAPYADNIDDELDENGKVSEADIAAVLAANETGAGKEEGLLEDL